MPDWDNTDSRERDEDAAWRDLVARFDAPLAAQQPVPWPAREDMPAEPVRETDGASEAEEARGFDGKHRAPEIDGLAEEHGRHAADGEPGRHAAEGDSGRHAGGGAGGDRGAIGGDLSGPGGDLGAIGGDLSGAGGDRGAIGGDLSGPGGDRGAIGGDRGEAGANGKHGADGLRDEPGGIGGAVGRHGRLGADGPLEPEVIQVPRTIRGPAARGVPVDGAAADDEGHFIPPTPPPLPKLDPVAKGAWAALFGGPGYLIVATAAGWSVSGLAAFCAVAAFVAGFAILVLRMHEPGPGGPDDGDDGAVV